MHYVLCIILLYEYSSLRRLLRVFSDDKAPDREVERISSEISTLVKRCEPLIHQVKTRGVATAEKDRESESLRETNILYKHKQYNHLFIANIIYTYIDLMYI